MENLLYEYMNRRFNEEFEHHPSTTDYGPVITISRQAGCGASKLAHDLCHSLNAAAGLHPGDPGSWHFINHEILERLAEKLNLEPEKLDRLITDKDRGIMDEILEALSSRSHKSDKKILKTMQEIIRQFAEQGHVVIVGRGGAVVSQHIRRSLHIRLEAPLDWRVEAVMKKLEYSREYSKQYIQNIDEQREMYVRRLTEGKSTYSLYDLVISPNRFDEKLMVDIIISIASKRGIH
jgi:cytidylate kinase